MNFLFRLTKIMCYKIVRSIEVICFLHVKFVETNSSFTSVTNNSLSKSKRKLNDTSEEIDGKLFLLLL